VGWNCPSGGICLIGSTFSDPGGREKSFCLSQNPKQKQKTHWKELQLLSIVDILLLPSARDFAPLFFLF
jgi:hypothetical protein